jgi:hypothetical protein
MERLDGIEPTTPAWKAEVLPLNYSREWGAELLHALLSVKPRLKSDRSK